MLPLKVSRAIYHAVWRAYTAHSSRCGNLFLKYCLKCWPPSVGTVRPDEGSDRSRDSGICLVFLRLRAERVP